MSGKPLVVNSSSDFQQSSVYLERPRLYKLLEEAASYPLIAIYAGAGYGKTRTVHSFLKGSGANTTWLQLTERDNVETRFWENYTHMISLSWPEIGERLLEIGFPVSDEAFAKYSELRAETLSNPGKFFLVYDDFHLLHNPAILHFFEKASNSLPPNATVILLSRTMPDINMTGMLLRERIFTIREDALCFTEDEIAKYFDQLNLFVPRQDIRDILEDTQGWAFAVNLIGRSLSTDSKYERYALEAMKANIYRLIETEISQTVSDHLWRFLLRISLIDNHAASLIRALACDDELIEEMERLHAYIRYDSHLGAYMIHHLFLDYLRQYRYELSNEEIRETFSKAGLWCLHNDYLVDAISHYEKSGDWDAIMRIVYTLNFPVPQDLAKFALGALNSISEIASSLNPLYPAAMLKLNISLGFLAESDELARKYIKEYEARPDSPEKNNALARIYGTWAVLKMMMCGNTEVYDFDVCFMKQREYYDKNPIKAYGPVTKMAVGSFALLIGTNRAGAPEEYIEALSRSIPHISHVLDGCFWGLDDLARGELFYLRRDLNSAEQFLKKALDKARAKKQYDIQNRSMLYLMHIAFSRGEIKTANSFLQQMEYLLDEKEYSSRYEAYDIACSYYYLALGQPEEIPDWLKGSFSAYAHPAFLESYANRVKAYYRFLTKGYDELLAFLRNAYKSQTLLIGRILFKALEALTLYHLKRKDEAISALTEAYILAEPNKIITPFTQFAKDMRTLTAAAQKDEKCTIPAAWLENINRKASAFARRTAHLISEIKADSSAGNELSLTKREIEILKDLSHGLSRSEIAVCQNTSVNTVKMNINIIYEKLHASNLVNAVRIAADRKII